MDSLKCSKCKQVKDLNKFHKDVRNKSGKRSNCISCDKIAAKIWKEKNKKHIAEYNTKYKRQYNYGLANEDYEVLLENQKYRCAVCNIHKDDLKRGLVVDHCHATGKYRGLLCHHCNVAIGMLKESEDNFMAAISYLRNYS